MKVLPVNVWLLTLAQSLMMSVASLVVFTGGLIGTQIAPSERLATLPIACMVIGTALFVVPVTMLMKKVGRRNSFILISAYAVANALLAGYAVQVHSFFGFCATAALFGAVNACVMQFRFAAMESVSDEKIPAAASSVLLGGIVAAFLGPETAVLGKNLLATEFVGSFVLLAVVFFCGFITLLFFKNPAAVESQVTHTTRPLREIARQHSFWVAILSATVGYAVMSFIMTATPVSMHVMDGHSLHHTKWVIQSHIVAMYAPSIAAAWVIRKLGIERMMITGLLAYLLCIAIAWGGHHLGNYWISLVLLGVGWNFLFIGGTTLLPQSYRPNERFKVQAVNEFIVFGTQAVAALSAGYIVYSLGWEKLLLFSLPVIAFQFVVVYRWTSRKPEVETK